MLRKYLRILTLLLLPYITLVLYYSSTCPYSQQVLDYLKKTDRTIPMIDVKVNLEGKEKLKSYGTPARVPCLVIEGQPLYDSGAIIDWLSTHP